jgi:signal transduction histidine kinase
MMAFSATMALAGAGWGPLQSRLLHGICHDLNSRIGALYAMARLVELGEPAAVAGVGREGELLEGVARRLAQLAGDVEGNRAPIDLGELLGRAVELHACLEDLDGARVESVVAPGLPAILAGEARCLRLLLLWVDAACRSGGGDSVMIQVAGDADRLEVSFQAAGESLDGSIEALDRLATIDGGAAGRVGARWQLHFPSLGRARERGL